MIVLNNTGPKRYNHNEKYFTIPNIKNSYWAGFIAADGCIVEDKRLKHPRSRLVLKIAEMDKILLEEFKHELQYDGPIDVVKTKFQDQVRLQINSAYSIISDLETHYNVVPRKSLVMVPPSGTLSHNDKLAFIKGYIDGDGSIYLQAGKRKSPLRLSLVGSEQFLRWVCAIFDDISYKESYTISRPRLPADSKIWQYDVSGKRAEAILSTLKNASPYGLGRKWNLIR